MGNSDIKFHGMSTYSTRPGSQHDESQVTGFGKKSGGLTPNKAGANRNTFASSSQIAKSELSAEREPRQIVRENQPNHAYFGYPAGS